MWPYIELHTGRNHKAVITMGQFIECLLCAKHYGKHFTRIVSFNPHNQLCEFLRNSQWCEEETEAEM